MSLETAARDQNTMLAMDRNFMAAERTLMAWIRTSLSMIGFGFTLAKLFQALAEKNVLIRGPAGNVWTAEGVGITLIALGVFSLIMAILDHRRQMKLLRGGGLAPKFSLSMAVASALAILGAMALAALAVGF
jgi:putative membrane protein